MKAGIQIARFDWPGSPENIGETVLDIANTADESGFDSIWTMDHFFQIEPMLGTVDSPMLEAYTTLGAIAAVTKNARIGTMVAGVIYREPALLVKAVTTLDVLSGGRAYFGIGAGWYEREAKGLGFSAFSTTKERFERLEEALKIAKQMWAGDRSPFHGAHYQLEELISSPQPLSKPHPPILIGGGGEKKTLKFVAQYGDACNVFGRSLDEVRHKFEVLKNHCVSVGRDYDEIEKTILYSIDPSQSTEKILEQLKMFSDVGVEHAILYIVNMHETERIRRFGDEVVSKMHRF